MDTAVLNPGVRTDALEQQATRLRDAYDTLAPITPIREALPHATIADAYAIQALNTAAWEAAGRVPVGAKIGLTAVSVQKQLGVEQPDYGVLFADMAVLDGGVVAAGRLLQPKVEAEIAFVLKRAPDVTRLTAAEIVSSVAYALPAIEIVDSRIADWNIGIVDTIADNASSGMFVLGDAPISLDGIDLRLCGMVLELDGEPVSFGAGAACLGNPLHALAWLARRMHEVERPLGEGDIVLAGALGPMATVKPGSVAQARISGVGRVQVRFEGANDHGQG